MVKVKLMASQAPKKTLGKAAGNAGEHEDFTRKNGVNIQENPKYIGYAQKAGF